MNTNKAFVIKYSYVNNSIEKARKLTNAISLILPFLNKIVS